MDVLESGLTDREKEVFSYIDENPGTTKEEVVDAMFKKQICSRVTTYRILSNLTEYKMIEVRKNRRNSQVHYLHARPDSIFLSVLDEFDQFEKNFIPLIQKIQDEFVETYKALHDYLSKPDDYVNHNLFPTEESADEDDFAEAFHEIELKFVWAMRVFYRVTQTFFIRLLSVWPIQISNEDYLKRLTTTIYGRIYGLQAEISKIRKEGLPLEALSSGVANFGHAVLAYAISDVLYLGAEGFDMKSKFHDPAKNHRYEQYFDEVAELEFRLIEETLPGSVKQRDVNGEILWEKIDKITHDFIGAQKRAHESMK
jgi:predicted transcriptional regulator